MHNIARAILVPLSLAATSHRRTSIVTVTASSMPRLGSRGRGPSRSHEYNRDRARASSRDRFLPQRKAETASYLKGKHLQEMYANFLHKKNSSEVCALADLAMCNRGPACRLCSMGKNKSSLSVKEKLSFCRIRNVSDQDTQCHI